jgi:hypothetical protein
VLTVLATLTVSAGIQILYFIQLSVARSYRTANLINLANAPSICTSGGAEAVDNNKLCSESASAVSSCDVRKHVCMCVYLSDGSVHVLQSVRTKGSVTQSWGCILSHSGGSVGDWGGNL